MRNIIWLLIGMTSLGGAMAQEGRVGVATMEYPGIQVFPIKDTANDKEYELYIELPESYSDNLDKSYPVLYYTDAIWHMEILGAAAEYILEDVILVGISWQKDIDEALVNEHGKHVSRFRDYSIQPSSNAEVQAKYGLGLASKHLDFIRNQVFSHVEKNYRTDPENRSYFGYSLGGLFGAYILLSQPDTFKNYILGSPALKGDIPFLSQIEATERPNANVFLSYGNEEKELDGVGKEFIEMVRARKYPGLSLTFEEMEGSHQTAFPMTGVESAKWLARLLKQ